MIRRNFVKLLGLSPIIPAVLFKVRDENVLKFFKKKETGWPDERDCIYASKGPLQARIGIEGCNDLIDCHGLCATMELAYILKEQLEFTPEVLKKSYYICHLAMSYEEIENKRQEYREKNRMFELTKPEFLRLYKACDEARGPHDCVCATQKEKEAHVEFWAERLVTCVRV